MSIKRVVAGSFIVAGGLLSTSSASAEQAKRPAVEAAKRPAPAGQNAIKAAKINRRVAVKTIDLAVARKLIKERLKDPGVRAEVAAIARKMGNLKDPSVVGAWGLGCGGSCSRGGEQWNAQPVAKRADAIKAAKVSPADRDLLIEINSAMGALAERKGDLVGAWGLGCGGSCSRAPEEFGVAEARPARR